MSIQILYVFNFLLIIRIIFQWNDAQLTFKKNIFMFFLHTISIVPFINNNFCILLSSIILYHIFIFLSEKFINEKTLARILQFIFIVIMTSFIFKVFNIKFNNLFLNFYNIIKHNNMLLNSFNNIQIKKAFIALCGVLIAMNEINNLIRFILKFFKIQPSSNHEKDDIKSDKNKVNDTELNRGKIIGILERILIFFFTLGELCVNWIYFSSKRFYKI